MNPRQQPENVRIRAIKWRTRGFALIVTLSLMILLSVVAVALMTLWSISLRTSGHGRAMAEARANARLALMLSIGELQKSTGPDTRITAPSTVLDPNNPPVTGVWRSWEGTDHEPTDNLLAGRPRKPDYVQKKKSAAENGRFLTWLVSSSGDREKPDSAASLVLKSPSSTSIALVSRGSR
jgi:type II secretory pathway pseudopilin PulG